MPTKNRVRRDDGGQFHQSLSAQGLAFYGQESALIIGQQKPFLPLCLHQGVKFHLIERDDRLLLAVDPTRENQKEEMPGLQDQTLGQPVGWK